MTQSFSPLDIATGTLLGHEREVPPLIDAGLTPRVALEQAILPALLRPPCLVSFSGGRDSSAVLAVAADLARREGLDLPIPATNVFPAAVHSDEAAWQTLVISHLGLDDWIRLEHHDELDIVGPYARRVMRRHGLLFPCNVHMHLPLFDAASGGSVLTGVGGDEIFAAAKAKRSILDSPVRRVPHDLAVTALSTMPVAIRQTAHRRRHPVSLPWLREEASHLVSARVADMTVHEPRTLSGRLSWYRGVRYLREGCAALKLIADDVGALVAHPFLAPPLWAAVGRVAGPRGFASRTHGMATLFGDLLPEATLARPTKAHFNQALWTDIARRFARDYDGSAAPTEYVDVDALTRHWRGPDPRPASFSLLQAAWIAGAANRVEEGIDGALV